MRAPRCLRSFAPPRRKTAEKLPLIPESPYHRIDVGTPWRRILILSLGFVLAIGGTFLFAYRAGTQARHFRNANEPIRPWMSIPFIAHTRHVPEPVLFQAIGVQPEPHDRRSVRHLAHDLKRPIPELMSKLQQAVDSAAHPSDTPPR
jgi:hypothetical protein